MGKRKLPLQGQLRRGLVRVVSKGKRCGGTVNIFSTHFSGVLHYPCLVYVLHVSQISHVRCRRYGGITSIQCCKSGAFLWHPLKSPQRVIFFPLVGPGMRSVYDMPSESFKSRSCIITCLGGRLLLSLGDDLFGVSMPSMCALSTLHLRSIPSARGKQLCKCAVGLLQAQFFFGGGGPTDRRLLRIFGLVARLVDLGYSLSRNVHTVSR